MFSDEVLGAAVCFGSVVCQTGFNGQRALVHVRVCVCECLNNERGELRTVL